MNTGTRKKAADKLLISKVYKTDQLELILEYFPINRKYSWDFSSCQNLSSSPMSLYFPYKKHECFKSENHRQFEKCYLKVNKIKYIMFSLSFVYHPGCMI